MDRVLALTADNTHLYPGARLATHTAEALPSRPTTVVVVFSDHVHAEAVLTPSDGVFVLRVAAYSTAAGTAIDAKSWNLAIADERALTVKSRADSPAPGDTRTGVDP